MGVNARRALWRYLETDRRQALAGEPLFVSSGGRTPGAGMTPSGVFQMVQKAGLAVGIKGVGPHDLRRTFAVTYLKNGDLMSLQRLMGHEDFTVLRRYVALAEADLAQAHRAASPVDRLKLK